MHDLLQALEFFTCIQWLLLASVTDYDGAKNSFFVYAAANGKSLKGRSCVGSDIGFIFQCSLKHGIVFSRNVIF